MKLEVGAACAVVGASIFSIHSVYSQHAGSLDDARQSAPGDEATRQRLSDADRLTGSLVLLVGGTLSLVAKRPEPLILAVGAFAATSIYYHRACEN